MTPTRALEQYREAVRLSPSLARAHFGIGVLMETRGQDREAIEAFTAAVTSDPGTSRHDSAWPTRCAAHGRVEESLCRTTPKCFASIPRSLRRASGTRWGSSGSDDTRRRALASSAMCKAFPDQPGFAHALARLLAAAPDDRVRDGARADAIMSDLLKTQQTPALAETMAMALAELGRFDEAVRWQREAIDLRGPRRPHETG